MRKLSFLSASLPRLPVAATRAWGKTCAPRTCVSDGPWLRRRRERPHPAVTNPIPLLRASLSFLVKQPGGLGYKLHSKCSKYDNTYMYYYYFILDRRPPTLVGATTPCPPGPAGPACWTARADLRIPSKWATSRTAGIHQEGPDFFLSSCSTSRNSFVPDTT
jgi:hypothetical protein